jgi:carbonic anhydrase
MSTENINITATNVSGNCDLKCSYHFKYNESNSTAKNNGVMISLTYDSANTTPVIFNDQKYVVNNISIVSPSIHLFDNNTLPGEIMIEHNPVQGGNNLNVCIPFFSSTESSKASQIITDIIQTVSSNAPSDGDSTNLNMSFTLQNIIPKKPFYMYEDSSNTDWIVFGAISAIPLSSSTISTLQQIITPYSIKTQGESLFYNSKGPVSGINIGDGIYISCNPTGSSQDEVSVEYSTNSTSSVDISSILNSEIFKIIVIIILGCLSFLLLFYAINSGYKYLNSDAINLKMPTMPTMPTMKK